MADSLNILQDARLQLLQLPAEQIPHVRGSFIIQGNRSIRLHSASPQVLSMCLPPRRRSLDHQAGALLGGASRNEFEDFEENPGHTSDVSREPRFTKTRVNRVDDNCIRIDGSAQLSDDVQLQ